MLTEKKKRIIPILLIIVTLISLSYLCFTLGKILLSAKSALLQEEIIAIDELENRVIHKNKGSNADGNDRVAETGEIGADQLGEPQLPNYRIDLQFDPEEHVLTGTSHITVWNRAEQSTDFVLIQAFMNAFREDLPLPVLEGFKEKAYPQGIKYTNMEFHSIMGNGSNLNYELDGSVLRLDLDEPWLPDQKLEITLQWETVIPEIHHRVGVFQDAFWFGNVLPIMAVYDNEWHAYQYETIGDPFFSEAANFSVTLQVPEAYEIITTGNELESRIEGGVKSIKVEATQVREFTFAITANHKVVSAITKSGIDVHLYYRYTEEDIVLRTLPLAVDMLDYLEARVGPYPYEQLNIFENTMFITGMEYPGLVFVSEHRLNSASGHVTVLHEIAHQWFYNIIGNNQILEPWLDEGFATYFTDEFVQGDKLETYYQTEQEALERRSQGLWIQSVGHYSDWSSYWRSNYRKSSFLIFDLRKRIGEDNFQDFIKAYYTQYRFKIATTEGMIKLMEAYLEEDIDHFLGEWGLNK